MNAKITKDEIETSRVETRSALAFLVSEYLDEAHESLRKALCRSADESLLPDQRIPQALQADIVNLRLQIRTELRRRGR